MEKPDVGEMTKFTMNIPEATLRAMKMLCATQGESMSDWLRGMIADALQEAVDQKEVGDVRLMKAGIAAVERLEARSGGEEDE